MELIISVGITVTGRVQGVFYRASTIDEAKRLGLVGWVKNQPNGDVYIHVEGAKDKINSLVSWCKEGPQLANVHDVIIDEIPAEGCKTFEMKY